MTNVTEGYSLCPTGPSETTVAAGTDANNNAAPTNNEISHQESCLWPNALQVGQIVKWSHVSHDIHSIIYQHTKTFTLVVWSHVSHNVVVMSNNTYVHFAYLYSVLYMVCAYGIPNTNSTFP